MPVGAVALVATTVTCLQLLAALLLIHWRIDWELTRKDENG